MDRRLRFTLPDGSVIESPPLDIPCDDKEEDEIRLACIKIYALTGGFPVVERNATGP